MPDSLPAAGIKWQSVAKIAGLIALLVVANYFAQGFSGLLNFEIRPSNEDAVHRSITVTAILYTILLAIPFVPGAEIGLALIAMLGPPIAILVYLCTVTGLSLSFIVGRLIPLSALIRFAEDIRLTRTGRLLKSIEPLGRQERIAFLVNQAPNRFVPFALRYRYIALAIALNVPGNFLIGGGGGIGLFAGISRLYSPSVYLITIAVSVAPIPLAVLIIGPEFLSR